jgi:spoIIIJ-associated protein
MSNSREFVGKNVEKALEAASKSLGLPTEKIKHDVISFGSSGIFGLVGVKKAKIRVSLPEGQGKCGRAKERDTHRSPASTTSAAVQDILSSTFGDAGKKKETVPKKAAPKEATEKKTANKKTNKNERPLTTTADQSVSPKAKEYGSESRTILDEEITNFGSSILQSIVDYITEDAAISIDQNEERTIYNITGGNPAVLIGKRGQTLEAIQYLLEKIINKKNGGRVRVLVDVEGYLDTRKENLERLAVRLSEKAVRVGKPMTIGQMNAHDRRIVHLHLKEHTDVRTQSIGEGYYRKLMIFPKKRRRNGRKQ